MSGDGLSILLSLRPPWSGITEARTRLKGEVEAELVLERKATNLPIRLAYHDHLGCDNCRDLELPCEFFFVPDLPVGGFESMTILFDSVGVVRHVSVRSALLVSEGLAVSLAFEGCFISKIRSWQVDDLHGWS